VTLADLALPLPVEQGRQYGLVFDAAMAAKLAKVWGERGSTACVPTPFRLADGRWLLRADLLSEIGPGGLLYEMWRHADQATLMSSVEVIPWADAVAMLPAEPAEAN
jgi:hypothetical protein